MRTRFTIFFAALLCCMNVMSQGNDLYRLVPGHDYYIWSTFYNRPMALSEDQSQPRLVPYSDANDAQYIYSAEAAPTSGYVLLKHKASGKYICASTTNGYSVVTQASKGTGDAYQWRVKPGNKGFLVNKRNTSACLGVDAGETGDYISVWYDKTDAKATAFEVFEATGKDFAASRKIWATNDLINVKNYIEGETAHYAQTGTRNTKYPTLATKNYLTTLSQVNDWLTHADDFTADQFIKKTKAMRDSLTNYFSGEESAVLLTETDMSSFGMTFSLSASELQLNDEKYPNDSLYVLIRSKEGLGAMITIKENGTFVFVQDGGLTKVYKDGKLKQTVESYFVPKVSPQGEEAEWTIIRSSRISAVLPELLSETKAVTTGGGAVINKYGNNERTVVSLANSTMDLDQQIDFHIISGESPLTNCKINLKHEKAWLIFDNVLPSEVVNTYLKQIRINGMTASEGTNCRVVIYLNGALVMPYKRTDKVFSGFDGEQYTGQETSYAVGSYKDLGADANRFRSFRLKRGYMATVASDADGGGYSRVYVADHQDIEVPVLPNALYGRISSITIKKWQYVSKKGYCSTKGSTKSVANKIRATWYYNWAADGSNSYDIEYVPIRQHRYWPSMSQIAGHDNATACLSINEPEHSEQHNNCDCKGALSEWTCCTLTPDFQMTGMRIGSPAPTDAGWLKNYIGHVNDMAYRCDFVAIHCYWGDNEAWDANAWYNQLKAIYDATKRPIWITEWAYGASWTKESWPSGWDDKLERNRSKVKAILAKLEEAPFVERYAYYEHDTQFRNLVDWGDGHITPAGKVYRDQKSGFAYNASVQFTPVWWAPALKNVTLAAKVNEADMTLAVTVKNPNKDCTNIMKIQKFDSATGNWVDYYTEENRSLFDQEDIAYEFPLADFDMENDQLRVYVKRTQGDEAVSAGSSTGYITNPNIFASSKTSIEGWKCQRSSYNGFTKATGDTYFEVWSDKAEGQQFDYYQDVTDLPEGIYELSADVFNTTDNVSGAKVNGSVVLYAQADTVQYLVNVTKDSKIEDCDRLVIDNIIVRNGTMRIGVKNVGEMSARWAGADNFKLVRKGDVPAWWQAAYYENRIAQDSNSRSLFFKELDENTADASAYVINPACQRNDNYAWTTSNTETASNESSDGVSGNNYWNLWKGSAYTSTMTQDITFLPEGKYSANALLRGSSDAQEISISAIVISPDETTQTVKKVIAGTGNTSAAGSPYKNGWQKAETDFVTVRPGDVLRLTMTGAFTKSGWWSADNFGLTWQYVDPIETGIDDIEDDKLKNENSSQVVYDLSGRKVTKTQKGIYIINNKKVLRK